MPWWIYVGFLIFVSVLITLDLCVLHRHARSISVRSALGWTCFWVSLAMAFNGFVYLLYGGSLLPPGTLHLATSPQTAAVDFFTGYLVEYSLSIDNIFVIAMIIANFHVPGEYQHRLLFWGILGAAVLRGVMILGGAALLEQFEWLTYGFALLLIVSAAKMLVTQHDSIDPDRNLMVRWTRKFFPVTTKFDGPRFFTEIDARRHATPMFLALILIESCDVMFAIDSIPAVFAVTRDPFIVFTSNIFAILGLRSLYFALAGMMGQFRYLKMSLVFLLVFVGMKMLLVHYHPIPNLVSLAIIGGILLVGVLASVVAGRKDPDPLESPLHSTGPDRIESDMSEAVPVAPGS
jgi:tellurite resistance protein TerC